MLQCNEIVTGGGHFYTQRTSEFFPNKENLGGERFANLLERIKGAKLKSLGKERPPVAFYRQKRNPRACLN